MSTETEAKREPTSAEQRAEGLGNFSLIHLAACLGTALAVVIAINLLD